MRFLCFASALATACAFTSQPAAFTTNSPAVGGRVLDDVVASGQAHRTRKSTIVMDGKANGKVSSAQSLRLRVVPTWNGIQNH